MILALFLALGLGSARADELDDALYERLLGPEETSAYDVPETSPSPAALPPAPVHPTSVLRTVWPLGAVAVAGGMLWWGRRRWPQAAAVGETDLRVVSKVSLGGTATAVLVEAIDASGARRRMLLGAAGFGVPALVADLSPSVPSPVPATVPNRAEEPIRAEPAPVSREPLPAVPAAGPDGPPRRFGALLRRFEEQSQHGEPVTRQRVEAAHSLVQGMLAARASRGDLQ